jgi:hypothetical protein
MPIRFEVDEEANHVFLTASGEVSDAELLQVETEFINDLRVRRGFRALFDATGARSVKIADRTLDFLVDLESRHSEKMLGSKLAVVVHDSAGWSTAKYFEARAQRSVVVFFNLDIAKAWLGLE